MKGMSGCTEIVLIKSVCEKLKAGSFQDHSGVFAQTDILVGSLMMLSYKNEKYLFLKCCQDVFL